MVSCYVSVREEACWHTALQVDGYAAKPVVKSWRQRLPWARKRQAQEKPQKQARMHSLGQCRFGVLQDPCQSMQNPLVVSSKQANVPFSRLMRLNKPEVVWAAFGCFASALLGAQMPAFSIALSSIIAVYYQPV